MPFSFGATADLAHLGAAARQRFFSFLNQDLMLSTRVFTRQPIYNAIVFDHWASRIVCISCANIVQCVAKVEGVSCQVLDTDKPTCSIVVVSSQRDLVKWCCDQVGQVLRKLCRMMYYTRSRWIKDRCMSTLMIGLGMCVMFHDARL